MIRRVPPSGVLGLVLVLAAAGGSGEKRVTEHYPREKLLDSKTCNECHQDFYNDWSGSMHAYAASDPLFLAMNKRGQEETHGALGNFCVNCHAPMATRELGDGTTIDPETLPEKLKGVTCYFCHNVTDVAGRHDNPLVLANDTTMRGPIGDANPYKAHETASSSLHNGASLRSADLCGACHDIVVPSHFSGATPDPDAGVREDGVALERTYSEWKDSTFSLNANGSCNACHMESLPFDQPIAVLAGADAPAMKPRRRHRHDFPAVDSAFSSPDFPVVLNEGAGVRDAQEERVTKFLDSEIRVQTCVDNVGNVNVTVENLRAGHRFPSGASQDRRLWIELHVYEQVGGSERETYQSGVVPSGQSAVDVAAAAAKNGDLFYLYRDQTTKLDGSPAHMFWDVAQIRPGTVPVSTRVNPLVNSVEADFPAKPARKPSRVSVTLWLEPVGLDVIDDLVKSGHLAETDAVPRLRDLMPRHALIPARRAPADGAAPRSTTLEWTFEAANAQPVSIGDGLCLQTTPQ